MPPSKPIFLNYISTFISPIKFHKEDRGTCLTVKSKGFSMALPRFSAENRDMKITTNMEVLTLSHTKLLLFECF